MVTDKNSSFEIFCDRGIVASMCAAVFVLPAAIAYLDSLVGLAVCFYFSKKIYRIKVNWPVQTASMDWLEKCRFIWTGLQPPANVLNRPLLLVAGALVVSVVFSQYPTLSVMAFFGKFVKCVFTYFSFLEAFSSRKRISLFLIFLLISAFITMASGLYQHFLGRDFLKGHALGTENGLIVDRINSSFFSANGLGAYLLPIIGMVTHLLFFNIVRRKSWVISLILGLLLVLLLISLCWTYSRSAWIGFVVIMGFMIMLDLRKVFLAVGLFLIFVFLFLPSLNDVRHLHLINDENGGQKVNITDTQSVIKQGGSGRFAYWSKAVSIIRSSPIYGTGLNTYSKILHRDPDRHTWWYAHNCYLQMAAETGLLGLGTFLAFLYILFKYGIASCRTIKDLWTLNVLQGGLAGLLGFMAQSFFDNNFYSVQLGMLMWMFFGLIVAVVRLPQSQKEMA